MPCKAQLVVSLALQGEKAKPAREKVHKTKSRANREQVSESPLSGESHRVGFTLPAVSGLNTSSKDVCLRIGTQVLFLKFQTPEGKQVSSIHHFVHTKSLRIVSHYYHFGNVLCQFIGRVNFPYFTKETFASSLPWHPVYFFSAQPAVKSQV
jgi:hypothetical protein